MASRASTGVLGKGKLKSCLTNTSPSSNVDTNQLTSKKRAREIAPEVVGGATTMIFAPLVEYESPKRSNASFQEISRLQPRSPGSSSQLPITSNVTLSTSTPPSGNVSVQGFSRLKDRSPGSQSQQLTVIKKLKSKLSFPM